MYSWVVAVVVAVAVVVVVVVVAVAVVVVAVVVVAVVVVFSLTRITSSVDTGQVRITLEWNNAPG